MSRAMSLKAKIRNIAKQKNIPAQVILQNYIGESTKKSFRYTPNSRLYAAKIKKKIKPDFECNVIANNLDIFTISPQFICKFTLQLIVSQI